MKRIALTLGLLLLAPCVAKGDQYRELLRSAHRGDVVAMRKVGIRKFKGNGTPVDRKNALLWLEKAADGRDTEALYFLGNLYMKGSYVSKNNMKAAEYFKKAADMGLEKAKEKLAELPLEVSLESTTELADKGDIKACLRIAKAYLSGEEGLGRDSDKGLKFFKKALKIDKVAATKKLKSWPLKDTVGVWQYVAENADDEEAALFLAGAYANGDKGIDTDMDMAKKYYAMAATNDNAEAVSWMREHGFSFETKAEKQARLAREKEEQKKRAAAAAEAERLRREQFQDECRAVVRKALISSGHSSADFLAVRSSDRVEDVTLQLSTLDQRKDMNDFLITMKVSQNIGRNQFLCFGNRASDAPVSVVVPKDIKVNIADGDKVSGVFLRDGNYEYETRSGQWRTVRNYILILTF